MASVRPMRLDDIDSVRDIDVQAFTTYMRQGGRDTALEPRTRENIRACLELNPAGCFIAEAGGPVGFIFSRRWGDIGWIGVFGVHPGRHGQRIGRQLLERATAHLAAAGCTAIGLETMADSHANVGMYLRRGFRMLQPTALFVRGVEPPTRKLTFTLLSKLEPEPAYAAVTHLSRAVLPGLDYRSEAANAQEHRWGETLFFGWPEPWACAIVRTVPRRAGKSVKPVAEVAALVVLPEARPRLAEVFEALEAFAWDRGLPQVFAPVHTSDWMALDTLRAGNFRLVYTSMRMVIKGSYSCPAGVDLSRWAM